MRVLALLLLLVLGVASQGLRQRWRNQFGKAGDAARWGAPVLFVPGHTLNAKSWREAVQLGSAGGNGDYAAVFSGKDGAFHRDTAGGPVLSKQQAAATNMYIVDFADVFAASDVKAKQIGDSVRSILNVRGTNSMQLNVVTHSAGDADFDTAAVKGYVSGISIPNRIAIGPVFDGTVMGNIGNRVLSKFGKLGRRLGLEAAQELAEGSVTIKELQEAQPALNRGIYRGTNRVDIQTNGVGPLTFSLAGKDFKPGDGFVQSSQRRPYVTRTVVVPALDPTALNHLKQPSYPGVLKELNSILSK